MMNKLPPPTPENTASEKESRQKLLKWARLAGCEFEVRRIVKKYDDLMRTARDDFERRQIGIAGVQELEQFLAIKESGIVEVGNGSN